MAERLGRHLLVDFYGVAPRRLRDRKALMSGLGRALKDAGFDVIREVGSHKFSGGGRGVTGFFLLAQSHAAFHSYPEFGYLALDIYSCGSHDPAPVAEAMRRRLKPKGVARSLLPRGTAL